MSKLIDHFPNYPTAGLKKNTENQSTQICIKPPNVPPKTPQNIYKYRKSFKEQNAVTIPHYGTAYDPLPPPTHFYGKATEESQRLGEILQANHKTGVNLFINNLKQAKYASSNKQPLAKSLSRNYNLPNKFYEQNFKYGKPTEVNQYSMKQTVCPDEYLEEIDKVKKLYLKSHQTYQPGEQKNRQFNWNVDPTDYRFGKVEKNPVHNQLKQILQPESQPNKFVETKFVKTNYNDFVNFKEDKLGKPRNLAQNKDLPPDFVFGIRYQPNQWGAGKCITGQATFKQVQNDKDLGKATKFGFKNEVKPGDQNRVFGVPTIRSDIIKPKLLSLANPHNYGDENRAVQLLFPNSYHELGISKQDFELKRDKSQIRQIFSNIGFTYKAGKFQAIFAKAKELDGTILDKVSCSAFLRSMKQLDHLD